MLRKIQTRLEFKILLLVIAVLIAGFGTYVVISIQSEADAMLQSYKNSMFVYSETVVAGIRNMMMTGRTPLTNEFLNDARKNLSFGSLTIYDRFGREVFLREGEGVIYNVDDSYLKATLSTSQSQTTMMKDSSENIYYTRFEPLRNQPECWRCHEKDHPLRGVIQLAIKPHMMRMTDANEAAKQMAGAMGQVVATAFRTIMLGGQGEQMDTLTAKATEIPSIARVQVYSKDAYVAFGPESDDVNEETVSELIEQQAKDPRFEELGKKLRLFIPLQNEERCQVCHGTKFPMRGVMVVDFYNDSLKQYLRDPAKLFTWALQSAAYEGFRSIMLVGRANSTRYYIDGVRKIPEIYSVHVFDREGNERFLNPKPRKREELATIITAKEKKPMEFLETVDNEQYMVRLSPIPNEVRCYTCHGKNHDLRAVVEVSRSMKSINEQITQRKLASLGAAVVTILLVWMVIRLFMNSVVVKPVQIIEGVASRVGGGDFSAQANVASRDEIGVLALRINEMVQG
ncbi:MAG: HAMP domain-containing protein, partial [Ignavibacteriales bacterium]|nr:HAMP domain-containing protein [Ignavibacteriales bacterium]